VAIDAAITFTKRKRFIDDKSLWWFELNGVRSAANPKASNTPLK